MRSEASPAPIIVTAMLGPTDFQWANALRRAHFPPERNYVPAHISLFHHLPPARLDELVRVMRDLAGGPPPVARLSRVLKLGRGVSFAVDAPELLAMREEIADRFRYDLIPQDQHSPRLHITIQNKASAEDAAALFADMEAGFRPRALSITGLAAWYYRGGPWELAREVRFRGR
jgi:hypothetical protein